MPKKWKSKKMIPLDVIQTGLKDPDWRVRTAAMNACSGREVPLDVIQTWLKDPDWRVRTAAMNACSGREVPLDVIQTGLKDGDPDVRQAAMNACQGREVPLEVIQTGLKDPDCDVRTAAMKMAKDRSADIPPYRSIEPPELVYKKCEAEVIVVAHIPDDAEVRGKYGGKCRANKAEIVEIIGTFCGEPVGISKHDGTTWYYKGDVVEVDDFDLSDEECSTGYHFFCTKEEAEAY